ncbi:MAG: PSK operon transcription factor [Acidobacteria bacterium]|nr:PSK operon transcription factor [Acidobacteriota bacterium]
MPISIKNEATEELARKLADLTGKSLTNTIHDSLQKEYDTVISERSGKASVDELMEIARRCANRPSLTNLTADEILGYDEFGLPT